jgi:hypothetical protein
MKKKLTGQLVAIKFTDRKEPIHGFVIDYNDDWTLLKYNPGDYLLDGYIILRHKNIWGYRRGAEEKFKEKIIKLKKQQPTDKEMVPISDLKTILTYLSGKFGVFNLFTKSESTCYPGKLKSIDSKLLVIDSLDTNGKWKGKIKFKPNEIRIIEFCSDYLNSLMLVANAPKK